MKKTTILFILILIIHTTFSQEKGDNYFAFAAGAGIPTGDFADKKYLREAGYARTGFHFRMSAIFLQSENFGLVIMGLGNVHPYDAEKYEADINMEAGVDVWEVKAGNWSYESLLVGIQLSVPGDVYFNIRLTGGLAVTMLPSLKLHHAASLVPSSVLRHSESDLSPAFDLGMEFRIPITNNLNVVFAFDYYSASAKFDQTFTSTSLYNHYFQGSQEYHINSINTSLGIGIRF